MKKNKENQVFVFKIIYNLFYTKKDNMYCTSLGKKLFSFIRSNTFFRCELIYAKSPACLIKKEI